MANKYVIVRHMASSADPRVSSSDVPCVHPRLILETSTKDRYLTGHYVCEVFGLHFDRPPIKQDPSLEQNQGRPLNGLGFLEILDLQNSKEHTFDHIALTHRTLGEERRFLSDPFCASRSGLSSDYGSFH
jgi:hypothetical protein